MCGRFTLFEADKILSKEFRVSGLPSLSPRYKIAPSQPVVAVRAAPADTGRKFALLRWGLIPSWSKDPSIGNRLINARAETSRGKPSFRNAFRLHRCLIPSNGFYESQRQERGKQPYFVRMRDDRLFAFAGLRERTKAFAVTPWYYYPTNLSTSRGKRSHRTVFAAVPPSLLPPDSRGERVRQSEYWLGYQVTRAGLPH
jgi:putative SOS response-associated peptidase YedK